jgi:hypothetical protein
MSSVINPENFTLRLKGDRSYNFLFPLSEQLFHPKQQRLFGYTLILMNRMHGAGIDAIHALSTFAFINYW